MMSKKKIVGVMIACMSCMSMWACREETSSDNTKDSIAFVKNIEDDEININAVYIADESSKELYYENDILEDDMICDASSLQPYFLIKSTDEAENDIIYDYANSRMYDLGFNRCSIIAETQGYIYIGVYNEHSASILAFFKENGSFLVLGEAYSTKEEYYESVATSNYDEDEVHFCYALNDGTYAVSIKGNILSSEKISDKSFSTVITLDGRGEKYFAMYNTISTPYKFEPTIIKKQDGAYTDTSIEFKEGGVLFSIILNERYYLGYSSGNMLEIYTLNENNMLIKMSEYENDVNVAYMVKDGVLYIRIGDEVYRVI